VESDSVERREDRMALVAILRAVPAEMKSTIAEKSSAKEAWMAVRIMRLGDERVREANAQKLLGAFENVKFRDGETIDEFAMRLNTLVSSSARWGRRLTKCGSSRRCCASSPSNTGRS
jgi:maltooligosyltrehalose synthase